MFVADLKAPWVLPLPFCSLPGVQRRCEHSSTVQRVEERLFRKIHIPTIINAQRLNRGTALFGSLLGKGLFWMQKKKKKKSNLKNLVER